MGVRVRVMNRTRCVSSRIRYSERDRFDTKYGLGLGLGLGLRLGLG